MLRPSRSSPGLLLGAWLAACGGPSPIDIIGTDPPNERVDIRVENDTGTPFCGDSRRLIARLIAPDLDLRVQDKSVILNAKTYDFVNLQLVNGDTLRVLVDFGFGQSAEEEIRIQVPRIDNIPIRIITLCAGTITFHSW
jgi:hypothetical protein